MNLNLDFAKSLNLNSVFSKSMNLNLKKRKEWIQPWFPLSDFYQRLAGRANNFWQHDKHSFRKVDKFVEIWYLSISILQQRTGAKFRVHKCFLQLWEQLF